ncbi:MAG: 2-amino-4-hydroxy-6-hydroxymethyldihydropteridine diphosphokinase [Chthoniobacteraceae bacterium]
MRTGIALGSNLGDRLANLVAGREAVLSIPGVREPVLISQVYETEPVGTGPDAGSFLNAVIEVESSADPSTLLAALRSIESSLGRPTRRPRNAPRTLDLDILYISELVLQDDTLILPHPRLHLRRFVLAPLNDIRPDLRLPGQTHTVAELLALLDDPAAVSIFTSTW